MHLKDFKFYLIIISSVIFLIWILCSFFAMGYEQGTNASFGGKISYEIADKVTFSSGFWNKIVPNLQGVVIFLTLMTTSVFITVLALFMKVIMKKISLVLVLTLISSCTFLHKTSEPENLYKDLMFLDELPTGISNLKGETNNSAFLISAMMNYTCDSTYVDFLLSIDDFPEKGELSKFNEKFHRSGRIESLLNEDFSLYAKHPEKYNTKFNQNNCILLRGVIFPYIHEILIDTTAYKVLHIVDEMRG